jgi:hypothetical protein
VVFLQFYGTTTTEEAPLECVSWTIANSRHDQGSEMTQIRIEDVDFSEGYLHVPATNAKFKKLRTVVLLPQVAEAIAKAARGPF